MVKNAKVPTARLVLDLNPDVKVTPRLVRHEEGAVVLSLGDEVAAAPAALAEAALPADTSPSTAISDRAPAPSTQSVSDMAAAAQAEAQSQAPVAAAEKSANAAAAAKPAAVTDAYEAYYQAFKAQKEEVAKETGDAAEWGPRKGSIGELKGARGIKALVTSSALAAPKIEPDMQANLSGQGREQVKPANAFAEAEANKAKNTIEAEPVAEPAPKAESAVEPVQQTAASAAALAPAPGATEKVAQNSSSGDWAGASQARNDAGAFKGAPEQRTAGDVDAASGASAKAPLSPSESAAEAPVGAGVKMEEVGASDAPEAKSEDAAAAVDSSEAPQTRARRLFNNAVKAHLSGQLAEAIAGYKSALAVDPELCDAHSNLGLAYNQQHNYASALSELRKALALNPKDAITYNGIGAALKAEKDIPGAIKNWETAVKLDSRLAVAHYNLGTAYEDQGDLDRALVSYENAIRNDGRLGEAYYRIGLIMQKKHRVEEAKEHYKKALKVSDNSDYSADAKQRLATLDRKIK
jgi:tetratricopeptide (TPR) repeat protein